MMNQIAEVKPDARGAGSALKATRLRRYGVLVPFALLALLWLRLFFGSGVLSGGPGGKAFDCDAAMFFTAARVIEHGGNPYDHLNLYSSEVQYLRGHHLALPSGRNVVRVGNPPLLFWLLRPFAGLPYQPSALGWSLLLYALTGAGFFAVLRTFGWKRRLFPLLLFLAMPEVLLGPYNGNLTGAVFASLAIGLLLARRFPTLAGMILVVAWLKPQVALPLAGLIMLFHSPRPSRVALGFGSGMVLVTAATLVTTGAGSLKNWVHALFGYANDMAIQPNISSLAGSYVRLAPAHARTIFEAATLATAAALTLAVFWRTRHASRHKLLGPYLLWFVWFLATPYAHFYDSIALAVPMVAVLGTNGRLITERAAAAALYLALFAILLYSWAPHNIQLLWLPIMAMGLLLWHVYRTTWASEPLATNSLAHGAHHDLRAAASRSA